jgi:hypothetical protein
MEILQLLYSMEIPKQLEGILSIVALIISITALAFYFKDRYSIDLHIHKIRYAQDKNDPSRYIVIVDISNEGLATAKECQCIYKGTNGYQKPLDYVLVEGLNRARKSLPPQKKFKMPPRRMIQVRGYPKAKKGEYVIIELKGRGPIFGRWETLSKRFKLE